MCIKVDQNGIAKEGIEQRGVLLKRRDNAEIVRIIYAHIVMKIFEKEDKNVVLNYLVDELNNICAYTYPQENFIITKSVGNVNNYKRKALPEDDKKRVKRIKDLKISFRCICKIDDCDLQDCLASCQFCAEYVLKCLPAHIQLAEKMRSRGKSVQIGSRIEYIICLPDKLTENLREKIEDPEYQTERSKWIKLDPLYYIHLMINSFDEILSVAFNENKFVDSQYKLRVQKWKYLQEMKYYFRAEIE